MRNPTKAVMFAIQRMASSFCLGSRSTMSAPSEREEQDEREVMIHIRLN